MGSSQITTVGLRPGDAVALEDIRVIYEQSFPASERSPFDEFRRELQISGRRVRCACDAAGHVCGFLVTLPLTPTAFWFGEYLAVAEASRSRGVGTQLLRAEVDDLRLAPAPGLIIEVEDPGDALTEEERARRARRISFYESFGGTKLRESGWRYLAPSPPLPGVFLHFLLMAIPVSGTVDQISMAFDQQKRAVLAAIFEHSYGMVPGSPSMAELLRQSGA